MKSSLLYIAFLLCTFGMAAQGRLTLQGKVTTAGALAPGVFVINKNTGTEVVTDAAGEFTLPARNGDRLVVYSNKTVVREFEVGSHSFENMPYEMAVDPNVTELQEVVIDQTLTPENLGLVPEGQRTYTPAQRRLKTATDLNPSIIGGFGLIGGALSLDPLINALTGRTKMLKTEMATERKAFNMELINNTYTAEQITATLGIPPEKVQGFLYYAIEDKVLVAAVHSKNDERLKLELSVLATQYTALQQETNPTAAP
jgi:hypothetical protein